MIVFAMNVLTKAIPIAEESEVEECPASYDQKSIHRDFESQILHLFFSFLMCDQKEFCAHNFVTNIKITCLGQIKEIMDSND